MMDPSTSFTTDDPNNPAHAPLVGADNSIAAAMVTIMLALGVVLIWNRLRARGRRMARHHRLVPATREQAPRRPALKLLRWKAAREAEPEQPEHKIA